MSKIICDVCGTSYPESSSQCPICGCVRSADVRGGGYSDNSGTNSSNGEYTYIKGGRFSKANVKKRNRGETLTQSSLDKSNKKADKKHGNTGLVIAVIILILAILSVMAYIYFRFFRPTEKKQDTNRPASTAAATMNVTQQSSTPPTETTEATEETNLAGACTDIKISVSSVRFDKNGSVRLLDVTTVPLNTTDSVVFVSSDESVVTVNNDGKLQAVGSGEAEITITCGAISTTCRVVCDFESDTTEPSTEPVTEPVTVSPDNFKLLKDDVTLSYKGESWICYNEDSVGIKAKDVVWSSDNEKVATVSNGKVVAVSTGVTTIRAKYEDMEATCVVRCSAAVGAYVEPTEPSETTESDGSTPTVDKTCTISSTDVTIKVGEQFDLILRDAEGYPLEANWEVSNGCCSAEGNIITGLAAGTAEVYCTYNDVKYTCIVRVY